MKTNCRSLFRALFGGFGFVSLAKGLERSSSDKPSQPTNREMIFEAQTEASTPVNIPVSTPRTVIHNAASGRIVQRVNYYDSVPIVTSTNECRHS